jgi:Phosphotransferase enzyme family
MSAEEPIALALGGGWEAGPVRIGDTVRRRSGRWTPAVHALLRHLESVGFDAAPRVLGVDGQGREVLSYIEGQAGNYPLPESLWSDAVLDQTAQLLRRYHDATVGFVPPVDASWLHGVREPVEVICHGDMAPYNCIYRGDTIIGFIDFDWAGPGPRLWDLAEAAYRFVPLTDPTTNPDTISTDQPRRLRRFVDHYGRDLCAGILDAVVERERWQIDYIIAGAEAGDPVQQQCLAAGHVDILTTNLAHIHRYRDELDAALA